MKLLDRVANWEPPGNISIWGITWRVVLAPVFFLMMFVWALGEILFTKH